MTINVQFTSKIPDELYSDKFTQNKTLAGTYSGPETLYVLVTHMDNVTKYSTNPIEARLGSDEKVVAIDCSKVPHVANYLINTTENYEFTYTTITNPDNSTHDEISNPRLNEYYKLKYIDSLDEQDCWVFDPNTITSEWPGLNDIKDNLNLVRQYNSKYSFSDSDEQLIQNFITTAQNWINEVSQLKTWRYKSFDNPQAPKIPISLLQLFATFPKV